jgi:hypothetical protein
VIYYAQNIQTGNASAQSSVVNNVEGNGSVTTHIETTANGQTNVIDANGNGQTDVENDNGIITVSKSPQITIAQTQIFTSTPTATIAPKGKSKFPSLVSSFIKQLQAFLQHFKNL